MERVYNFSAGPAMIDPSVLQRAADEMLCYGNTGMSVMEMSHRSNMYLDIYNETVALLRELMHISDDYEVLFVQGGATLEFSAIPLNLMVNGVADYIDSGNFAHLAAEEAKRYGTVNVIASSREDNYTYIPDVDKLVYTPNADYVYITTNNTIYGTRYTKMPETGAIPLVGDASSHILSEEIDVNKFGVLYAGAQKNIGPAGLAIVIVRKDLLGNAMPICPKLMNWALQAKNGSMLNTPNTYGIYMAKLVFEWVRDLGGISAMYERNLAKATKLYDAIDNSKLFKNNVRKEDRSLMNATFVTGDPDKDAAFVKCCTANGLLNIKGHRSVGGMRASIYNAMPAAGVDKLIEVMHQFEKENA